MPVRQVWKSDAWIRGAGALLLIGGWIVMRHLFGGAGTGLPDFGVLHVLAAASGFSFLSSGAAFATLGRHLFDEVRVAERRPLQP